MLLSGFTLDPVDGYRVYTDFQEELLMDDKRKIEVFSAGCPACAEAVKIVNRIAVESGEVEVLDMHRPEVAERAGRLGVRSIPAVAVDGKLADCCAGRGVDEATLQAAGVGAPLP